MGQTLDFLSGKVAWVLEEGIPFENQVNMELTPKRKLVYPLPHEIVIRLDYKIS